MKILITGGSGFLGINLVRFLLNKGFKEIVVLDIAGFDYPEKDKITFIKGDIRDKTIVRKAMENCNLVIHTAAALPLYKKKDIFSTEIEGAKNLLAEAFSQKVARFIHISSSAVYGIPDHHPLFENDKLDGVGPYGIAKIEAEKACLKYRQKGMCIPILRPKSFVGPERLGVFAMFFEWAKEGKNFPIIGNGKNRYQFLDVEDLCGAIFLVMTKDEKIVNDTFNIGAKEFSTAKEDYQAVLDTAGFGKKIRTLPPWPAISALKILEFLHLSPLYKWIYESSSKDSFVSIDKAQKILGFNPKYSNKEALVRNYKWYLKNYHKIQFQSGISHRVPWKQGILKLFKIFF